MKEITQIKGELIVQEEKPSLLKKFLPSKKLSTKRRIELEKKLWPYSKRQKSDK